MLLRIGLGLIAVSLFLIALGGQGCYSAIANGQMRSITYQQFVREKPGQGWFTIKDCAYDLSEAYLLVSREKYSKEEKPTRLYIPIHGNGAAYKEGERAALLVITEDPALMNLYMQSEPIIQQIERIRANPQPSQAEVQQVAAFIQANGKQLLYQGPIDGMVEFGMNSMLNDSSKLDEFKSELDTNFRLMKWHAKPDLIGSMGMFWGGVGLLAFAGFIFWLRSRD